MRRALEFLAICSLVAAVGLVTAFALELGYVNGLVLDHAGARVEGALVVVVRIAEEGESSEEIVSVGSALTDDVGGYELAVVPGTYELYVTAEGFAEFSGTIEVYQGMTYVDPIALSVPAAVTGVVLASDGVTPIVGSIVTALGPEDLLVARTDASGAFAFLGLPAGDYVFQPIGETERFLEAVSVTVAAGDTIEGIIFVAEPEETRVVPTVTGGIAGRVVPPEGRDALSEVVIMLVEAGGRPVDLKVRPTNAEGSFVVEGLAPGTYGVYAGAQGHAFVLVDGIAVSANTVTEGIEIQLLTPVGEIRGEVLDAQIGAPIVQALVMAASENSLQVALTDDDGSFVLPDLPGGTYAVVALAEAYEEAEATGVEVRAGGVSPTLTFRLDRLSSSE